MADGDGGCADIPGPLVPRANDAKITRDGRRWGIPGILAGPMAALVDTDDFTHSSLETSQPESRQEGDGIDIQQHKNNFSQFQSLPVGKLT